MDLMGQLAMLRDDQQLGLNLINKSLILLTGFGLIDALQVRFFGLSFFCDFGPSFNLWFLACGLWFCLTLYGFICVVLATSFWYWFCACFYALFLVLVVVFLWCWFFCELCSVLGPLYTIFTCAIFFLVFMPFLLFFLISFLRYHGDW